MGRLVVLLADVVAVRDTYSLNLVQTLGRQDVLLTADPAFLLQPVTKTEQRHKKVALVSLREWVDKALENRLIREVSRVLTKMLDSHMIDGAVFLPFQMWETDEHDDRRLFLKLLEALPEGIRERVTQSVIPDPQEMVNMISTGSLMIGERLHSIILSAVAGVPFVALGYDRKVEQACLDLGMSEFCLDIHDAFGDELLCKVEAIEKNRGEVEERLRAGCNTLKQRALLNKKCFREFVEKSGSFGTISSGPVAGFEEVVLADLRRQTEKLWNRTEELIRAKGEIEEKLIRAKGEIEEKIALHTAAQAEIAEQASRIEMLEMTTVQKNADLEHIHNSQGWKALLAAYRARDAILPMNSVRRSIAKRVFRIILGILKKTRRILTVSKRDIKTAQVSQTEALSPGKPGVPNLRAIAFYLPQFHPIPENDEWWGKGFTEWTNVSKANPLFEGHYQPHIPGELGYYDLRSPQTRKAQAKLAREYGIHGFCYYHYWFNGKLLLNQPLDEVLASGEPEFPFCLCWANEDWTRAWDGRSGEVLIGQAYNHDDDRAHMRYLAPIFTDNRYIRVGGKPLFLVYRANRMPDPKKTAELWREEARSLGIGELYLCRVESFPDEHADPAAIGFDASVEFQPDWTQLGAKVPLDIDHSVYTYRRRVNQDAA